MRRTAILDPARLPDGPLVVAVSGGMDSMVMLHALRFFSGREGDLVVAHLDHAMRPGSHADASWVRGICTAWSLPIRSHRLQDPPSGEEAARIQRYQFLQEARSSVSGSAVLTAHHADDQAETILFRVLRGTGVEGLRGIPRSRGGFVRPLLDRWRRELAAYAREHAVPYRRDPTNADPTLARNALRHSILPAAESRVAAGSRRSLVRLAENATRHREELRALDDWSFQDAVGEPYPGRVEIPAPALDRMSPPLQRRLLRYAARRAGVVLSRRATDLAQAAVEDLQTGRGLDLSGGLRLERAVDRWILLRPGSAWDVHVRAGGTPGSEGVVVVPRSGRGEAVLRLGPVRWRVVWGPEPLGLAPEVRWGPGWVGPLTVRGWRPGDRVRRGGGDRSVARLMSRTGIPALDRACRPLALDRHGRIVWVPGVTGTEGPDSPHRGEMSYLACTRVPHG